MAPALEVLICGWLTAPAGMWRQGDDLDRQLRIPVPAYVVEHQNERVLIDCGLNPDSIADPGAYYGPALAFAKFEQESSIGELVDLGSIDLLVVTHLHYDHVGALPLVPHDIPLLVQRAEWEAGQDPDAVARNYFMVQDYAQRQGEIRLIDGDYDLFGDDAVVLLSTPGHTPGHQSVRVGRQILGADVCYFSSTLDDLRFPPYGDDHHKQRRSAQRLRAMRDAGFRVLPGHDPSEIRPGRLPAS